MVHVENETITINRAIFHAAVISEIEAYYQEVATGASNVRRNLLRRLDTIAGLPVELDPEPLLYFAYGSNLLESEIETTAPDAEPYCTGFVPRYRFAFGKHSTTRGCDAATIVRDETGIVWGYLYEVSKAQRGKLIERERGYELIEEITVYGFPYDQYEEPKAMKAFTFITGTLCDDKCGVTKSYLELVLAGARSRNLPATYVSAIAELGV